MPSAFHAVTIIAALSLAVPAVAQETVSSPAADVAPAANSTPVAETPAAAALARPATPPKPAITLTAHVDLTSQRMSVSVGGRPRSSWAISSGRSGFETPTGTFRPSSLDRMHYSRKYDLAPMPHSVFINGGVAVHATQATGMLGHAASHGCIRLAPGNAAEFFALVQRHGLAHTQVRVTGRARQSAPAMAQGPRHDRSNSRMAAASYGYVVPAQNSGLFGGWGQPQPQPQVYRVYQGRPVPMLRVR